MPEGNSVVKIVFDQAACFSGSSPLIENITVDQPNLSHSLEERALGKFAVSNYNHVELSFDIELIKAAPVTDSVPAAKKPVMDYSVLVVNADPEEMIAGDIFDTASPWRQKFLASMIHALESVSGNYAALSVVFLTPKELTPEQSDVFLKKMWAFFASLQKDYPGFDNILRFYQACAVRAKDSLVCSAFKYGPQNITYQDFFKELCNRAICEQARKATFEGQQNPARLTCRP
jgi:hypothetical protein